MRKVSLFKITDESADKIKNLKIDDIMVPNNLRIKNISHCSIKNPNVPFSDELILNGIFYLEDIGIENVMFDIGASSKFLAIYTQYLADRTMCLAAIEKIFEIENYKLSSYDIIEENGFKVLKFF